MGVVGGLCCFGEARRTELLHDVLSESRYFHGTEMVVRKSECNSEIHRSSKIDGGVLNHAFEKAPAGILLAVVLLAKA